MHYLKRKGTQTDGQQELGGEGDRELYSGYRVSVWDAEKVLEMDSRDGCAKMRMYLKMDKRINVMYKYFITIKKKGRKVYLLLLLRVLWNKLLHLEGQDGAETEDRVFTAGMD